ncbi:hypothetical protein D3C87_1940960 [compost metagenome]
MLSKQTQQMIFAQTCQFRQLIQCNIFSIMTLYILADHFNFHHKLLGGNRCTGIRMFPQQLLQQEQEQFFFLEIRLFVQKHLVQIVQRRSQLTLE